MAFKDHLYQAGMLGSANYRADCAVYLRSVGQLIGAEEDGNCAFYVMDGHVWSLNHRNGNIEDQGDYFAFCHRLRGGAHSDFEHRNFFHLDGRPSETVNLQAPDPETAQDQVVSNTAQAIDYSKLQPDESDNLLGYELLYESRSLGQGGPIYGLEAAVQQAILYCKVHNGASDVYVIPRDSRLLKRTNAVRIVRRFGTYHVQCP
jgi:hypothetical protein